MDQEYHRQDTPEPEDRFDQAVDMECDATYDSEVCRIFSIYFIQLSLWQLESNVDPIFDFDDGYDIFEVRFDVPVDHIPLTRIGRMNLSSMTKLPIHTALPTPILMTNKPRHSKTYLLQPLLVSTTHWITMMTVSHSKISSYRSHSLMPSRMQRSMVMAYTLRPSINFAILSKSLSSSMILTSALQSTSLSTIPLIHTPRPVARFYVDIPTATC
jgi:hypothetical protein